MEIVLAMVQLTASLSQTPRHGFDYVTLWLATDAAYRMCLRGFDLSTKEVAKTPAATTQRNSWDRSQDGQSLGSEDEVHAGVAEHRL